MANADAISFGQHFWQEDILSAMVGRDRNGFANVIAFRLIFATSRVEWLSGEYDALSKCGSEVRTKAGFIGEVQRWLCKSCGCKYTRSTRHGMGDGSDVGRCSSISRAWAFARSGGFWVFQMSPFSNGSGLFGEEVERMRRPGPPPKIAMIDEMWHFVHAKNECWLWISMCYLTRCILGVHVGGRSADDLKSFLKSFPQAQGRITFTDDLAAYAPCCRKAHISPARCTRNGSKASTPTSVIISPDSAAKHDAPPNARAWPTSPRCSSCRRITSI